MVLRLVLAEDNLLMREGISAVLALDDGVEVVAVCEDFDGLLAAVAAMQVRTVATDDPAGAPNVICTNSCLADSTARQR